MNLRLLATQYRFRSRIELKDGAGLIRDDHAVGCRVQHGEPRRLAHDQARCGHLDRIADQIAERAKHRLLGDTPVALGKAVVEADMAPPHAVHPDREGDVGFDLLIFEILA